MRKFDDLSERELLALAIASEEEDGRIYADFAHQMRDNFPDSAGIFVEMAKEEQGHRRVLIDLYTERFGDHILLVRRQDVAGFVQRRAAWQVQRQGIEAMRRHAGQM